jgi:uncharacterized protein (TIGR02679 family)
VLDAVAERAGGPSPGTAEEGRRLWASVGIIADGLSSTVLTLGLRPIDRDPLARFVSGCTRVSEAASITLSLMQRWPIHMRATVVYAFENPSMLAEAARLRWSGPPVVCTSGWPNVAALTLLRQLRDRGCTIRYHGDFDSKGIAIADVLRQRVGVEPWRIQRRTISQGWARLSFDSMPTPQTTPMGHGTGRCDAQAHDGGVRGEHA